VSETVREGRIKIDPEVLMDLLGLRGARATAFYMDDDALGIRIAADWLPPAAPDAPLPEYVVKAERQPTKVWLEDEGAQRVEVPTHCRCVGICTCGFWRYP
jgi:hypothetical protein